MRSTKVVAVGLFIALIMGLPCAADVVTLKSGDELFGTVTETDNLVIVNSRIGSVSLRKSVRKTDVASIQIDQATQLKPMTDAEAAQLKMQAEQAKQTRAVQDEQDKTIRAQEDAKKDAEQKQLADQRESVRKSIATGYKKRDNAQAQIVALTNQENSELTAAQNDYLAEFSIQHPGNQDAWAAAALTNRNNKMSAIRMQYGTLIAQQQGILDASNVELSGLEQQAGQITYKIWANR